MSRIGVKRIGIPHARPARNSGFFFAGKKSETFGCAIAEHAKKPGRVKNLPGFFSPCRQDGACAREASSVAFAKLQL